MEKNPIPIFDCDDPSNLGLRWQNWIKRLENYFSCSETAIAPELKKSRLLHYAGQGVHELYEATNPVTDEDKQADVYAKAKFRLEKIFNPERNMHFERFTFRQTVQRPDENIDQFYTRLKIRAKFCEFNDVDVEITGQVIQSCHSDVLRRQLLQIPKLTIKEVLQYGRSHDVLESQATMLESAQRQEKVNAVTSRQPQARTQCRGCGARPHPKSECPAQGKTCNLCGRPNHYASVCESADKPVVFGNTGKRSTRGRGHGKPRNAHSGRPSRGNFHNAPPYAAPAGRGGHSANQVMLGHETDQSTVDPFSNIPWNTIFQVGTNANLPYTSLNLDNNPVRMMVDTGCSLNIIDEATYRRMRPLPGLKPNPVPVHTYNNSNRLNILGEFSCQVGTAQNSTQATITVVAGHGGCLLGYETAVKLDIVRLTCTMTTVDPNKQQYVKLFPTVFSGKIGKIKGLLLKLHIDETIRPVAQPHRPIPFHLRAAIEEDINTLLEQDVIEPVIGQPTGWLSQIVAVPKEDGKIRICTDSRLANRAIARERYKMPTIEEIVQFVQMAEFFTKLDLNSAFEQAELHPDSRHITTFATHTGIYRYKRLNFGICCATEIFHQLLRRILQGLKGVLNAHDDIIVFGQNREQHRENLLAALERLRDNGITLNLAKCKFEQTEVKFFGLIFSAKGVRLSHEKRQALLEADKPQSQSELHSFLGLSVYCSRFIQDFATVAAPLWQLTKKDAKWEWSEAAEQAFQLIKSKLSNEAMGYFNTSWSTTLMTDASPVGIAAVLTQTNPSKADDKRIIAYASKSLTDTEKRYSQIEKEGLAVVWSCERLSIYLIGSQFEIQTDNKAIELILHNPSSKPPSKDGVSA